MIINDLARDVNFSAMPDAYAHIQEKFPENADKFWPLPKFGVMDVMREERAGDAPAPKHQESSRKIHQRDNILP